MDYSANLTTILKWTITVLIAGFIGQFGKKFASYLIDKYISKKKKTKESEKAIVDSSKLQELKIQKKIEKEKAKQIKKLLKAQKKSQKDYFFTI